MNFLQWLPIQDCTLYITYQYNYHIYHVPYQLVYGIKFNLHFIDNVQEFGQTGVCGEQMRNLNDKEDNLIIPEPM